MTRLFLSSVLCASSDSSCITLLTLADLARHAALKSLMILSAWGGSTNSAERSEGQVAAPNNARRVAKRWAFSLLHLFNLLIATARSGSSNHAPPALLPQILSRCAGGAPPTFATPFGLLARGGPGLCLLLELVGLTG